MRLFSVTLHDDNLQEFDTRWKEILLSMSKTPSDNILESLYKLRIRGSAQLKIVFGIVRHGDSSNDMDAQLLKKLKTMEKRRINQKLRSRNFDAGKRELKQEQWPRIERD